MLKGTGLIDESYVQAGALAARKNELVRRARSPQRTMRELDNLINYRWITGQPWYKRIPDTTRVVGLPPDQRQRYIHVNKTFEIVRTLKGVMYHDSEVEAVPRTGDSEDAARASMAEAVAKHVIQHGGFDRAYSRVIDHCNIAAGGWIKVMLDPTAGSKRPLFGNVPCPRCGGGGVLMGPTGPVACGACSTQGMILSPEGAVVGPGQVQQYLGKQPEGEIVFLPVHPDDVFIDPEAPTVDDAERLVHRARMSKAKAWSIWGRHFGMNEEDLQAGSASEDNSYAMSMVGPQFARPAEEEYVYVYEYWEKPCQKYPEGLYGVCIGNHEVVAGPLPDISDHYWCPFFWFPMYEMEGMQFGLSTVDLCLPLIMALNDHLSLQHARARLSAKLRWKMPRESRAEIDDRTGNMEYNGRPGWPSPEPIQLSPYPQDAAGIIQILSQAIQDLSGAADVVRGQFQDPEASGRAMAFLEERAIGPLKPVMAEHARRREACVRYAVELARVEFDDGRLLRIPGETGAVELQEFRAENVGECTDVKLNVVRHPGRSRATLMAELNEAASNQMIDAETYATLAEFGDMGQHYADRRAQKNTAIGEHRMLRIHGQMPPPRPYQNHIIHEREHMKFLAALTMNDPNSPLIPIVEEHIRFTRQYRAQETAELMMAQQGMAQQFGMANAADPSAQPQATQEQVQATTPEPYPTTEPGPPGSQPSIDAADASAQAALEE